MTIPDAGAASDVVARRAPSDPMTTFIGRIHERAALREAVCQHRVTSATGPGGVGKTRLALAVTADLANEFPGGTFFVDLATVTDPAMIGDALADAVGVLERAGASRAEAVIGALGDAECIIVFDNCEHVADAARRFVELLVARCAGVRVLATSRSRLMLAGERVFPVLGMSIEGEDGGDAVDLFVSRATDAGVPEPSDRAAVAEICRILDGVALAIELAAARAPSVGLDGLRRALRDSHDLLSLDHRSGERHASLRAAIDWSYRLLDDEQQGVMHAVAVFAAPFDLDAAAAVLRLPPATVIKQLSSLVEASLVTLRIGSPSRYRMLETIRQYATGCDEKSGNLDTHRARHLAWCADRLSELLRGAPGDQTCCEEFDAIADDARAALTWTIAVGDRPQALAFADLLAAVAFQQGRPSEAQQRFTQAADLADDVVERCDRLFLASRAALARYAGSEAVTLLGQSAAIAADAGRGDVAALALARSIIAQYRHAGTMTQLIDTTEVEALLARCDQLADGSPHALAALAVARAGRDEVPRSRQHVEQALAMATAAGDELLIDAALDTACILELEQRDLAAAADIVKRRRNAFGKVPVDARTGMDHSDLWLMASHIEQASGRLDQARRDAARLAGLPFLRDQSHVARTRQIEVEVLAGDFDAALRLGESFEAGWRRAGRPRTNYLAGPAYAIAAVHGLKQQPAERDHWLDLARAMIRDSDTLSDSTALWPAVFDSLVLLHRNDYQAALDRLDLDVDDISRSCSWLQALWLPWYAALWAEAAGLARVPDAHERLRRATTAARGNDTAQAIITRTEAVISGRFDELPAIAKRLMDHGAVYQADRTIALGTVPYQGASGPLPQLSPREREVLQLVAFGKTNPQIAAELHISRKTAEHHVSNILTKLGLTARTEAAALAGQVGLTNTTRQRSSGVVDR